MSMPVVAVQHAAKAAASELGNIISLAQPVDRERKQQEDYLSTINKETQRINKLQGKTESGSDQQDELVKALVSRAEAQRQL